MFSVSYIGGHLTSFLLPQHAMAEVDAILPHALAKPDGLDLLAKFVTITPPPPRSTFPFKLTPPPSL